MERTEERQRLTRWMEESQHQISAMIPRLLDDHDHFSEKLEASEQESARLRDELSELKRQVGDLQSETESLRNERAAIGEALSSALEYSSQIQRSLEELHGRLLAGHSAGFAGSTV